MKQICLVFWLLGPSKTFGLENVRKNIQIIYAIYILRYFKISLKGRWKRETMGVRKEQNVRQWSWTVAIKVYLQFEHAAFE
jgi:hypothetical protein